MKLYCTNDPTDVVTGPSPIRLTGAPSLVLDTVKRGEDDEDVARGELPKRKGRSVILRIYDSLGGASQGTIEISVPNNSIQFNSGSELN
jgi:alpha-mannosidase